MYAALQTVYFISASLSILFSIFILSAQKVLKLNRMFFYLGLYLLPISIITLLHALLYMESTYPISPQLLSLVRIFGLAAGYPLVLLISSFKKNLTRPAHTMIAFSVITTLLLIVVIDLIFNLNLLFLPPPPKIHVTLFFKILFIPFSFIGLAVANIYFYVGYRIVDGKNKNLILTLFLGMLTLLPFEYWDLFNLLVKKDPFLDAVYVYNIGIIILFLFVFAFILQFVHIHIQYHPPKGNPAKKNTGQAPQSDEISSHIYEKVLEAIKQKSLYLDPEMTLEEVSDDVNEHRNIVSKVINRHYGHNFNVLLNSFRVDDMKRQLEDPGNRKSILEVGMDAGINSKTSINRIFFKHVKISPTEYRKRALEQKKKLKD